MTDTSSLARELGAIEPGATFLRTMNPKAGRVFEVEWVDDGRVDLPGYGWSHVDALSGGAPGWQRVPTGYVLPSAIEWHAATVRLIEARRAMKADPTTGTKGIDACIEQMRSMAGMVST